MAAGTRGLRVAGAECGMLRREMVEMMAPDAESSVLLRRRCAERAALANLLQGKHPNIAVGRVRANDPNLSRLAAVQ